MFGLNKYVVAKFNATTLLVVAIGMCVTRVAYGADQILDQIVVSGQTQAQAVVQTPTTKAIPYSDVDPGVPGTDPLLGTHNLLACQGTGTRGLYCLDANGSSTAVLRWQNPDRDPNPATAITCTELGLAACVGMTVDLAGNVWVSGQPTAGGTYSLIKAVEKAANGSCPAQGTAPPASAWNTTSSATYCFRTYASGRARIYDLSMIDGPVANGFQFGKGVLALEDPAPGKAVFYADQTPLLTPVVLNDKWGNSLANGEVLQGLTLLQRPQSQARNFLMVSSSLGKELGFEVPWSGNPKAFDTGFRLTSFTGCTAAAPYDLRASGRTQRMFFSTGTCSSAYDPVFNTSRVPVTFPVANPSFALATSFALTDVTVSPGIEIDFVRDGCVTPAGCQLIKDGLDGNAIAAASFADMHLDGIPAGWIMYLVKNLPDCRYLRPKPAVCAGAVVNADGSLEPFNVAGDGTQQSLNITPLLPIEIIEAFPAGFWDNRQLLLQREYHARASMGSGRSPYVFDAIFGVPEDGLTYRETFDVTIDVADLLGIPDSAKLGCGGGQLPAGSTSPPPWDVIVNVSELAPTVGGWGVVHPPSPGIPSIGTPNYVSILLNTDCFNPTKGTGIRGSAFLVGLERAPKGTNNAGNYVWPDSTFALLMRSLARDFNDNLYTYTCQNLDGGDGPPVNQVQCDQLKFEWANVLDKLTKCVNATDKPKSSAGANACGSFETQFESFRTTVGNTTRSGSDPYNRFGEFNGRFDVLSYMYYQQFKPSIKTKGFTDPNF
jgi:hypothetical protein